MATNGGEPRDSSAASAWQRMMRSAGSRTFYQARQAAS
ncbi:hypothetical protein K788_0004029 [Paraburkholderia caribensis MBA4]|uniref:Uncharacterized protein n=1 Tax=Paraburkholderia caribensis MBA4 TaxID=1323664 RepID=A0A0P0R5A7_9BURK|nr:hypothetical protein K788_0004029 [Paraburkholderia caribensis MBA4]